MTGTEERTEAWAAAAQAISQNKIKKSFNSILTSVSPASALAVRIVHRLRYFPKLVVIVILALS